VALELVGGQVSEEFHAVAPFDERQAFSDQSLELDRTDFRSVLLLLAALLGDLVGVELALHAVGCAVEDVHGRPEQVGKIGFEARVLQRRDQRVEDVSHGPSDELALGQWSRVGLVLEGTVTVELKLGEGVIGRR
jgi:hypothetical protein